ncbi:ribonuclease PH [Synergistaceae bacterium OttesenSCG-928-I11]|nr:ribonuclease PH [Synergistaceae bacterium OttesenSCG-928-I11]
MRPDGRRYDELRPLSADRGINRYAEGSLLLKWGNTVVHCTASVEDRVPPFMRGQGTGWVSAEYSMLPRATHERTPRDVNKGRINGRSSEIQRLIGRSLRAAVDLNRIGERTIWLDCDVLQADGGTRTASITGAFVCLVDALRTISGVDALVAQVAAVSVGKVNGVSVLDLCYEEDRTAEVDCNVVMNSRGEFVELQGTGEGGFFSRAEFDEMLRLADTGLTALFELQRQALDLSASEKPIFTRVSKNT